MIKRTIEISSRPMFISVKNRQLQLEPADEPGTVASSIPCEDIGVLILDHPQCVITHSAIQVLAEAGASVIVCGKNHLPTGCFLPLSSNHEVTHRLQDQISASKPVCKRLWKQLVQRKIVNQSEAIRDSDPLSARRIRSLASEVKSGDTTNVEAHAARLYWASRREHHPSLRLFKRTPQGEDTANRLLDYTYAILRAAVARALVSSGFQPALGIHHANRSNAFSLADDLVEPLRPWADRRAFTALHDGRTKLDRDTKLALLPVLTDSVKIGDESGPLLVAVSKMTASFGRCLKNQEKCLALPGWLPFQYE